MVLANLFAFLTSWEPLRLWLAALLSPAVTLAGFIFVSRQFALAEKTYKSGLEKTQKEQDWKKAEFLGKEARDFFGDKRVERVISILDWSGRYFDFEDRGFNGKCLLLADNAPVSSKIESVKFAFEKAERFAVLSWALRNHDDKGNFSDLEAILRDEFDWFFFRLGMFQQFIDTEVVEYKEFDGFLNYIIDLVAQKDRSQQLGASLTFYIERYKFYKVADLIKLREAYLQKQIDVHKPAQAQPA